MIVGWADPAASMEVEIAQVFSTEINLDGINHGVTIRVAIRLTVPGEVGVDVAIGISFSPSVPEDIQDQLTHQIRNGVHAGLAIVDLPLPSGGLQVKVQDVSLVFAHLSNVDDAAAQRVGYVLNRLMMGSVAGLRSALGDAA